MKCNKTSSIKGSEFKKFKKSLSLTNDIKVDYDLYYKELNKEVVSLYEVTKKNIVSDDQLKSALEQLKGKKTRKRSEIKKKVN